MHYFAQRYLAFRAISKIARKRQSGGTGTPGSTLALEGCDFFFFWPSHYWLITHLIAIFYGCR